MRVLIVYATNSGGTAQAVDSVSTILRGSGHDVDTRNAGGTTPENFNGYSCVIFATPTWDYADKEGQPHEDFIPLMDALKDKVFDNTSFAILGLGDSSYTHFCGAVDIFEKLVGSVKGKLIVTSLRIDRFYQKPENMGLVEEWARKLSGVLSP